MMLDRAKDGTLLDGHGNPLPEGQQPVFLPFEVYQDVDFNELDFGEFKGEFDVNEIRHVSFDFVLEQMQNAKRGSVSVMSRFMAPRRHRPPVKIIVSSAPSGVQSDGFGTRIINVNKFTPQLRQVLFDELNDVINGFIEGRNSINNMSTDDLCFAELTSLLVDCTPNDEGKPSRFNCLTEYMPETYLEDLAKRLFATYEIDVAVVDGPKGGLLLKNIDPEPDK